MEDYKIGFNLVESEGERPWLRSILILVGGGGTLVIVLFAIGYFGLKEAMGFVSGWGWLIIVGGSILISIFNPSDRDHGGCGGGCGGGGDGGCGGGCGGCGG